MKKRWIVILAVVVLAVIAAGIVLFTLWGKPEEVSFTAEVIEIEDQTVTVKPLIHEEERKSADRIRFDASELKWFDIEIGDMLEITYRGDIREGYSATIDAVAWELATDLRGIVYVGDWLDKDSAEKYDNDIFDHIRITSIYDNCFFARTVIPMPYEIKINGTLSEDWCVGDQVLVTYENTYYDKENHRVEVDMLAVEASSFEPDPYVAYKPVIYLYPQEPTAVSVRLDINGELTCTYPAYQDDWQVIAYPDGTLTDGTQTYNYLYWEGTQSVDYDLSQGYCIKGEDTATFLEWALAKLGLTRREANEFIVYWLPQMQDNPYNIITFQTDGYTDNAALTVDPAPDTLIRVFMAWQASDRPIQIQEPLLIAPERTGFTVVEWGGTEIKDRP